MENFVGVPANHAELKKIVQNALAKIALAEIANARKHLDR